MLGRSKIEGGLAGLFLLVALVPMLAQSQYPPARQDESQLVLSAAQENPQGGWLVDIAQVDIAQAHPQPQDHASDTPPVAAPNAPPHAVPHNQPGHAGAWLRKYKDMSPAQQRRVLESDPQFRKLSPPRQIQLLRMLQHFSSLPPQQQELMLGRMDTWEHLTASQKQEARQVYLQFRQLPPDRRKAVNHAIRGMRNLTPNQRDQLIASDQFQRDFSPQERFVLGGAAHLPLAPGGLQTGPPE